MERKDFSIFCHLLSEIHLKAFGEPLSRLSHSKAQTLSWLVFDATGELISYKSLTNYVSAALQGEPRAVNPNASTLSILVQFAHDVTRPEKGALLWFRYRCGMLSAVASGQTPAGKPLVSARM